jgi:hypothetical protein
MDDELKTIYENVNRWLTFAEAKNALLVVANGSILVGVTQIFQSGFWEQIHDVVRWYFISLALFSLLGLLFALLGLLPKTRLPWGRRNGLPQPQNDNLLYFGHISRYSAKEFFDSLKELLSEESDLTDMRKAYCEQIVTNSMIAQRKYDLFKVAGWLTFWALATPILGVIVLLFVESD